MKILFLCVANAARSQMAEGWAKEILGPGVEVRSAGSKPCGYVHPWAKQAMNEVGIDLTGHTSKSLAEIPADFLANLDYVITLCADEICPTSLHAKHHLAWPLLDPAADAEESKSDAFRVTRNKIETLVRNFAQALVLSAPSPAPEVKVSASSSALF